ncbi:MAG TPA: TetR/AcrR family transcriptional regulator [Streptosporangiaceae bacterium]|jgi:AcrR family transcriptional regulator|nr:TetR/AcrR family transcriptional regulator [Streptosporangiaceae bacterium]
MTAASTDQAQPGAPTAGAPTAGAPTKGDRTRQRLLDAAAAEVARHGRAGASLTAIAAAAGLKPGSIYFHFGSRDQLIDAMLQAGVRESLIRLDRALAEVARPDQDGDPRARLRAAIRAHLTALHDLRDYAAVVLAPALALDGPPGTEFRDLRRAYLRQWSGLVEQAQRAGVLAAGVPPPVVRDLLLGALNSTGLAGRPVAETAAAAEALIMIPSAPR